MRRLIIIIAVTLPMQTGFALQLKSGQAQSKVSSGSSGRTVSSRSRTAATRTTTTTTKTTSSSSTDKSLLARVTVYWASGGKGSDRYTRKHKTATGTRLQTGHCAVDPRHIPYGSKVTLPDGSNLAAVDTGTAVKNRKAARKSGRTVEERNAIVVDKFFETKRQALAWAKTHPLFMPIKVATPNAARVATPTATRAAAQTAIRPGTAIPTRVAAQTTTRPGTAIPTRVATYNSTAPIMKAQPVAQPTTKSMLVAKNNVVNTRTPAARATR